MAEMTGQQPGKPVSGERGRTAPRALRPLQRSRLYEQLVERLLALVHELDLKPGDRLPPERELAADLGVSRASVRQALVVLEVQGLVEVRHGEGAVLLETTRQHEAIVSGVTAHRRRLPEVIEAREALEVQLASLAAQRRTPEDLDQIDRALAEMAAEVERGERGLDGDERFHGAVTAAARSGLLADLMTEISAAIRESRVESLSQPERPRQSLASHRRIAEAIRAGDADVAASAMREHIRLVSDVALLREE
jgi:GntR family transcriptional regulator, transcriptional repressor for pyruvate dehydrogenase complex